MANILSSHLAYGFIARTFNPDGAAECWSRILGCDTSHLLPFFDANGANMSIKLRIRDCPMPPFAKEECGEWITDYIPNPPVHKSVIPQTLYVPRPNGSEAQQVPHYVKLQAPIFFLRNDDPLRLNVGINLAQAAQGDTNIIENAHQPLTRFAIQTTTLVIWCKGRPQPYEHQLCLWDKRTENSTTLARLAKKVGVWTRNALQRHGIPVHPAEVWLVGIVPVCTGHWQVIMYA